MPDAANADARADEADRPRTRAPEINTDHIGEELADDARIWRVYDRVAKEDDDRRIAHWNRGLDNLALFAGLFSAVTTAFIIEAQNDMKPDYAQLTFQVLNATSFQQRFVPEPFSVPPSARTVNCLWIASLVLSLSAALIAIMGKDWISTYTARPVCNLRQWAEMRTYRLLCVDRWYMSGVIAAAPVLLHISLLLFVAGLVLFISSDPFTHHLTLGLSLAAGALYLVTALSAIVFSASPFKSPATQMIRAALSGFFSYVLSATTRPKSDLVGTLLRQINMMVVGRADESEFIRASLAEARPPLAVTGHAAVLSRLHNCVYPPERNAVASLLRDINVIVLGRGDGFALLPRSTPGNHQRHNLRAMAAVLTSAGTALVASVKSLPSSLRAAYQRLEWSRVQMQLRSLSSLVRLIPFSNWFLSSLWTDLAPNRRPQLLAEALSWLNAASQAPDVFRALVFALGDLDVGPQVGRNTSLALRTRLRAEIRRTWQQVDFLMLSRYVLADRNIPGKPELGYAQFRGRFDLSKNSALRCEDGLAALIAAHAGYMLCSELVPYLPAQVAQPKMPWLLLPHIRKLLLPTDVLILLANQYRTHLRRTNSFNLGNLEAYLYQTLHSIRCNYYANAVNVKYGATAGAIELLTFLCCDNVIENDTKPAAVELIMELLWQQFRHREHRCLAYLFGSGKLWYATWKDKHWSPSSLHWLSISLHTTCRYPCEPSSARTRSDDREFDLALARTVVMILSPQNSNFALHWPSIEFLFGHLCQSPSPSFADNDEELGVIRLILESAALLGIVGIPPRFNYDDRITWGTAILVTIMSHLSRRLRTPETVRDGERLLAALARTEVEGQDGEIATWDLGDWLRTKAPEILEWFPYSSAALQRVHDALSALYPLCEFNSELRVHWDRIGYPGRPGDIFSSPFLDIGEFFATAEDPLWFSENFGSEESSYDSSNDWR